jgi:hypothetical protein
MKELGTHEHNWPDMGGHLFGEWMTKDRKTKWRKCVHPNCNATEELDVSHAPA